MKGNDTAAIKADTEALEKAFYPIAEKMYAQAQNAQGAPGADAAPENGNGFYNADFEDKTK